MYLYVYLSWKKNVYDTNTQWSSHVFLICDLIVDLLVFYVYIEKNKKYTYQMASEIKQDYPLNLSISVSGGKEIN